MDELLTIFCDIADASFAIDGKQRIMFWNPAAERLLGIEVKRCPWPTLLAGIKR
ncbi:MAG: PAS domain-containing protein [Chloroflexi bacterium]|nr:PAS domain-containing protein [Chloroflexota bacterium]